MVCRQGYRDSRIRRLKGSGALQQLLRRKKDTGRRASVAAGRGNVFVLRRSGAGPTWRRFQVVGGGCIGDAQSTSGDQVLFAPLIHSVLMNRHNAVPVPIPTGMALSAGISWIVW